MSAPTSQVVVGFDFSYSGRAALERAIALAIRAPFHVLHFVCAIERRSPFPAVPTKRVDISYAARVQEAVTAEVTAVLDQIGGAGRIEFFVHARIGKPAQEILDTARSVGADLIIVGSKGLTGLERAMLGSVSERVVREAHCTVEVARDKTYDEVRLLEIVEVAPDEHHYVPPHRYTYEDHRVSLRPPDWPLY